MANVQETLIDYLRDAYAMEQQAISIMDRQIERLENYPEMTARLRSHRAETERQAERIETALQRLGTDTSSLKTGMAKLSSNLQAMMNTFAGDEAVKDVISNYTFEHYEIVNYKILKATAETAGEMEIARLAEESLREEEQMASWVEQNIGVITKDFLSRIENPHMQQTAKR
ncbi:ferritin-like domain-containing protein [Indioceanicola profundi]|uniref:ferritin-like domain-containing protein n=1 Tax=Indioceanicola profundi TaxID=2220096 RepID=UPI000E6AD5D2|nr:ferritin-like domain-containing protein [Indioceanicola profundi]